MTTVSGGGPKSDQQAKSNGPRFFGKYRGTVVDSADPEFRGRIIANVPDVFGEIPSGWALPCMPVVHLEGGMFAVPSPGASVWMEFEQGDPEYPIWTGGFWPAVGEGPVFAKSEMLGEIVLQSLLGNMLLLDDPTGGILIESAEGGCSIHIGAEGITLIAEGSLLQLGPEGIILATDEGGVISLAPETAIISNGEATIAMAGPAVSINEGALEVI